MYLFTAILVVSVISCHAFVPNILGLDVPIESLEEFAKEKENVPKLDSFHQSRINANNNIRIEMKGSTLNHRTQISSGASITSLVQLTYQLNDKPPAKMIGLAKTTVTNMQKRVNGTTVTSSMSFESTMAFNPAINKSKFEVDDAGHGNDVFHADSTSQQVQDRPKEVSDSEKQEIKRMFGELLEKYTINELLDIIVS